MEQSLTVACVLWKGSFRKRRYDVEWVEKLQRMVQPLLPAHRFICLSNVEVPCERVELTGKLEGWWAKLELFRPDNGLQGRVLYLDLDTLPVDDLTDLAFPSQGPTCFMPPSYTFTGGIPSGGKGIFDRYQTSCFSFMAGTHSALYTEFSDRVRENFRGDQDWVGYRLPSCGRYPPEWFRKLKQCQDGPPEGVKLVLSMPWKNDIAAEKFEWVRRLWN